MPAFRPSNGEKAGTIRDLGQRALGGAGRCLLGFDAGAVEDADPDRAADAGAVGRAVAVPVLVEVLLVVLLCSVT